ncbi:MAG: hypothetical protein WC572_01400 [Candidatus Omnitrophota bacterium]
MEIKETYRQKKYQIYLFLGAVFILLLYFDQIASCPVLSTGLDRFILFNIDESLHYCYIKAANFYPVAYLNPFAKIGFTAAHGLISLVSSQSMTALRALNSIYAVGVLVLVIKLSSFLRMPVKAALLSAFLTISFPVFFLGSISILVELMFSFLLVLALYLFYKKRFFSSSLAISLLPLVHQYGFFYIFLWVYFLGREKQAKLIFPLFIPFLLWSFANTAFLGHPLIYTLCYRPFICPSPPLDCLVSPRDFLNFYILLISPLVILFTAALMRSSSFGIIKGKLKPIIGVIVLQAFILLADIIVIPFFSLGSFVYKLRIIIPFIPLASVVSVFLLEHIMAKARKLLACAYVLLVVAALFYCPYSVGKLQRFPLIKNEILSPRQEADLLAAGKWLGAYMEEKGVSVIVCQGDDLPSSVTRRIWMFLPGKVRFLTLNDFSLADKGVFDVLTYKKTSVKDLTRCLFITRYPEYSLTEKGLRLIKDFPLLSLYVYGY